ncbi:hypothetical protein Q7P37_010864 [Cladosporium fusiforme]
MSSINNSEAEGDTASASSNHTTETDLNGAAIVSEASGTSDVQTKTAKLPEASSHAEMSKEAMEKNKASAEINFNPPTFENAQLNGASNVPAQPTFLGIPQELRDTIYELVAGDREATPQPLDVTMSLEKGQKPRVMLNTRERLPQTCSQIRNEYASRIEKSLKDTLNAMVRGRALYYAHAQRTMTRAPGNQASTIVARIPRVPGHDPTRLGLVVTFAFTNLAAADSASQKLQLSSRCYASSVQPKLEMAYKKEAITAAKGVDWKGFPEYYMLW